MIRIDAHHHVWQISRNDYGWLTPDLPIHRDYTLDDLRPLLGDITGTVLIQAAPTAAETTFLLGVARESGGLVKGVVGWTDLQAADAPDAIAALAENAPLKGLRPMLQDIEETDWILRDDIQPALRAMTQAGLRLDALIQPRHLPALLRLCAAHPDLPVVIDHAAKPERGDDAFDRWADDIAQVAKETPAFCKLSGLPTQLGLHWQMNAMRPYVSHLLACFGPDRLMWGSDWPVVEMAGGYVRWRVVAERLLFHLPMVERAKVLGGTAMRFYGLT
jgi:L-fuconolactonase